MYNAMQYKTFTPQYYGTSLLIIRLYLFSCSLYIIKYCTIFIILSELSEYQSLRHMNFNFCMWILRDVNRSLRHVHSRFRNVPTSICHVCCVFLAKCTSYFVIRILHIHRSLCPVHYLMRYLHNLLCDMWLHLRRFRQINSISHVNNRLDSEFQTQVYDF